ncbi:MAG: hypothetical protein AAF921_29065 [Cyanobacteria bacterium P01_D01_bin.44]
MDSRDLHVAKYLITTVSLLLIALGGKLWPFTWWDMYSDGDYSPPTEVERLELHIVDKTGQQHILRPMDLYTLDDDKSSQAPGPRLIRQAIEGSAEQQAVYRPYLIRQVEFVLDTRIEQVEIWRYSWQVDFDQQPPIDIDQPMQTVLVDRITASTPDLSP